MLFQYLLSKAFGLWNLFVAVAQTIFGMLIAYLIGIDVWTFALCMFGALFAFRCLYAILLFVLIGGRARFFEISASDLAIMMNFAEEDGMSPEDAIAAWSDMTPEELENYIERAKNA